MDRERPVLVGDVIESGEQEGASEWELRRRCEKS